MRKLMLLLLLVSAPLVAQNVRYRSESTVYLDAGSAAGIAVGDRFEVLRGGSVIAQLEVIYVAERSASCRIASESSPVQSGDAVRRIGSPVAVEPRPPAAAAAGTIAGEGAGATHILSSISGTASLDVERDSTEDHDHDRTMARVSVRARDLAGLPIQARIRLRASNERRSRALVSGTVPDSENRNRLYEASLAWEPRNARFGLRAGRLGNTPYIGLGYLDGVLARVRITSMLEAGAFAGYRPDPRDLAFSTSTTKAGAFVRVGDELANVTVAGVTQQFDEGGSSQFVAVDGRYAPSERFSFFAHGRASMSSAEEENEPEGIDTMLGLVARTGANTALTVAYERVEPGIDDDLRTADERINDFLRQGFRVTYARTGLAQTNFIVGGGIRTGEEMGGDDRRTLSGTLGVSHPNLMRRQIFAGVTATAFSSPLTDGLFLHARTGKRFARGHMVELSAGALATQEESLDDMHNTIWVRAAGWVELPRDLFTRAELELATGDQPAGQRLSLGVGYRF